MWRSILAVLTVITCGGALLAQSPSSGGPQFDEVSIKLNATGRTAGRPNIRPDGGLTLYRVPLGLLISRAYPDYSPADMVGLPDWAMREYYDLTATSSLSSATPADRAAMMRAMLVDRCKLAAHIEPRERDVYELVIARSDGKLGAGLTKTDTDCSQPAPAENRRPDFTLPPPPCFVRIVGAGLLPQGSEAFDVLEGDAPIGHLADALRMTNPGRPVVDRTGLTGSYRMRLLFNMGATLRPPTAPLTPDDSVSVFTALPEQLGLKLQPTRMMRDMLVIDHVERPTPN